MTQIPILPESEQIVQARSHWRYTGEQRPDFAEPTTAGQESVWDFPRPPRIEPVSAVLRVFNGKQLIAQTERGCRVVETAGAPTYYFPPADVDETLISFGDMTSICEWKGVAQRVDADGISNAGWRYVRMFEPFAQLYEWPSFYPNKLLCFIDNEKVEPQPGGYYGGWVTRQLTGPIKGGPDSGHW
ncbi:MAG: DUF427 domain-containing protein [Pseudomonadota bacterium]